MAEMIQNPLDDRGFLDAGDHPQRPAALAAGLNVDGEYPLAALCLRLIAFEERSQPGFPLTRNTTRPSGTEQALGVLAMAQPPNGTGQSRRKNKPDTFFHAVRQIPYKARSERTCSAMAANVSGLRSASTPSKRMFTVTPR